MNPPLTIEHKKASSRTRSLLRRFSHSVFRVVEPEPADGESYLENLWDRASLGIFAPHLALAVFLSFLPPVLFFHWRLFPSLTPAQQDRFFERLFRSRLPVLRWTTHSVRASAILFFFRLHRRQVEYFGDRKPVTRKNPPILPKRTTRIADYIVVGSGAAGLAFASALTRKGKDVVVLEEGSLHSEKPESAYELLQARFRGFGYQTALGKVRFPILQGTGIGGTFGVSGRILHPIPQTVYETWEVSRVIPYEKMEASMFAQAEELSPSAAEVSAPTSSALARLGWKHSSMKIASSEWPTEPLRVISDHRVLTVKLRRGRAEEVWLEKDGQPFSFAARKGIVLACGAIHTPAILWNSGIEHPSLGKNLQCHLSVSGMLEWDEPLSAPSEGVEVRQFQSEGIKLAGQAIPPDTLLLRTSVVGDELRKLLRSADRLSSWMANVRAESQGRVYFSGLRGPLIRWEPTMSDCERTRRALHLLGTLALEMGARTFYPGITGTGTAVRNDEDLARLANTDLDPRNYFLAAGHLFGTCGIGTDPETSVVDPTFRVRGTENLYCIDASLFPSNTGVNPLLGIMGFARLAAESV